MSFARPLLPTLAAALLIVGCGSADEQAPTATATAPAAPPGASARTCTGTIPAAEGLHVTGVGCDIGRGVAAVWANEPSCAPVAGGSRSACAIGDGYRCLGAATNRGIAVSCARSGSSIAFIARRDERP